jgi:aspartyl-tRNA(Asn)/glutamyl-tRNA(Gln) amidotransferase subunit B
MNESEDTKNISDLKFDIKELAKVIDLVNHDELSSTNSKQVVEELFKNGGEADIVVDENNLRQKNDISSLEAIVEQVLKEFVKQVEEYKA